MTRRHIPESVAMSRVLSRFIKWAAEAPEGAGEYAAHSLVLLTRVRLGMTQAQLASRCGMTQSHIANIENGKVDAQLTTMRRIFKAMHCRLVIAPQPEASLEHIIEQQARKAAAKRVQRVAGTMALEAQRPDQGMLDELILAEMEKLMRKPSSEIWEVE